MMRRLSRCSTQTFAIAAPRRGLAAGIWISDDFDFESLESREQIGEQISSSWMVLNRDAETNAHRVLVSRGATGRHAHPRKPVALLFDHDSISSCLISRGRRGAVELTATDDIRDIPAALG